MAIPILRHDFGFVYGIKSLDLIKVGVTSDIDNRLNIIRLHNPHGCELVFFRRTYAPYTFEKKMHQLLADKAVGREWFRVTTSELRKAAAIAKSSSIKARNALDRSYQTDTPAARVKRIEQQNQELMAK